MAQGTLEKLCQPSVQFRDLQSLLAQRLHGRCKPLKRFKKCRTEFWGVECHQARH